MKGYKIYAYVQKGISHGAGVCEDTALTGRTVLREGYTETVPEEFFLTGVADGMGGMPAGDFASRETMRMLAGLEPAALTAEDCLREVERISSRIRELGESSEDRRGMGCTLTLFCNCKDGPAVIWLGNSRLYKIFGTGMVALTVDHNLGRDEARAGNLSEAELDGLLSSPQASYLTAYMGMPGEEFAGKAELRRLKVAAGDEFLLTTDGLHDRLGYEELLKLTETDEEPEELLRQMAERAVEAGSSDDISMVLVRREERGEE